MLALTLLFNIHNKPIVIKRLPVSSYKPSCNCRHVRARWPAAYVHPNYNRVAASVAAVCTWINLTKKDNEIAVDWQPAHQEDFNYPLALINDKL